MAKGTGESFANTSLENAYFRSFGVQQVPRCLPGHFCAAETLREFSLFPPFNLGG